MAEIKDFGSRLENYGAAFVHFENASGKNPEMSKAQKMLKDVKDNSCSIDFAMGTSGKTLDEASNEIVEKCRNNEEENHYIFLNDVLGNGLTSYSNEVIGILRDKRLPNGMKLPENARVIMTSSDKNFTPEMNNNAIQYGPMLEKTCGSIIRVPEAVSSKDNQEFDRQLQAGRENENTAALVMERVKEKK